MTKAQWTSYHEGMGNYTFLDVDTHDMTFTGSGGGYMDSGMTQLDGSGGRTPAYPLTDNEVYGMRWTTVVDENVYRMADGEGGVCRDCLGNWDY